MADKGAGTDDVLSDVIGVSKQELRADVVGVEGVPLSKTEAELLQSKALDAEDTDVFATLYEAQPRQQQIIPPTYNPTQLATLVQQNNTLCQAVSAMEVNVDGTGFVVERRDGEVVDENDSEAREVEAFFDEPFPGWSWVTLRRRVRRDIEETGNGYIEVLRDLSGRITLLRWMDAKLTRLVHYDDPIEVDREIDRAGHRSTVKMRVRERRYAQVVGSTLRYFREFGSSRHLHLDLGRWEGDPEIPAAHTAQGGALQDRYRASEVLHFTALGDVLTPYGVPRWINQVPSVLGSRRAEEFNLEMFANGGVPPVMIFLLGGVMNEQDRRTLTNYLAGKAKLKNRAVLATVTPVTAGMDQKQSVTVQVERFGSEQARDSMFENYDERCAERVRGAFRLPPLFLGKNEDYNFATAKTSYMVAEAQVFQPEREEFDEIINRTIMRELFPGYRVRSLPMQVKDVEGQLRALETAKGVIDSENFVDQLNEVVDLNMIARSPEELNLQAEVDDLRRQIAPGGDDDERGADDDDGDEEDVRKRYFVLKAGDEFLIELAADWAAYMAGERVFDADSVREMIGVVKGLSPPVRKVFNAYVGQRLLPREAVNPDETYDLLELAGESLAEH